MEQCPGTLVVVGGSDFFGPDVSSTSFLGDTLTKKIVTTKGKASTLAIGSADVIHDFAFVPDFAKALLIENDRALDRFWICPHAVQGTTIRQIAQDIAQVARKPKPSITVFRTITVHVLSLFMSFMFEMKEMLPIWTRDYQVDDSEFCREFGIEAAPYKKALQEYVNFYEDEAMQ